MSDRVVFGASVETYPIGVDASELSHFAWYEYRPASKKRGIFLSPVIISVERQSYTSLTAIVVVTDIYGLYHRMDRWKCVSMRTRQKVCRLHEDHRCSFDWSI